MTVLNGFTSIILMLSAAWVVNQTSNNCRLAGNLAHRVSFTIGTSIVMWYAVGAPWIGEPGTFALLSFMFTSIISLSIFHKVKFGNF